MSRELHVEFRGKEVTNPVLRALAAGVILPIAAVVSIFGAIFAFIVPVLVIVVFSPVLVPLHFILRALGRKGFMEYNRETDYFTITVNRAAFQRVNR